MDFIRLNALPPGKTRKREGYAFSDNESIFTDVLDMPGWKVSVEIIQNTDHNRVDHQIKDQSNTIFSHLLDRIKEQDLLFNLGLISKREGIESAAVALYYHITAMQRTPVLIYNSGYNWDDSLAELYREGMVMVYRIQDEFFINDIMDDPDVCEEVRNLCSIYPEMRKFDHLLGIDVSLFFIEWFSFIIGRSIQESTAVYHIARKKISGKKIQCLLHSARDSAVKAVTVLKNILLQERPFFDE